MGVRAESRASLLEAAVSVLARGALGAVQKLLSPEALEGATRDEQGAQGLSRHTAYRLWSQRSEAVTATASHLSDIRHYGGWDILVEASKAYEDAVEERGQGQSIATVDHETRKQESYDRLRKVLRVNFQRQLSMESMSAAWFLHCAALTSSPIWGGPRPGGELEATGRQVLSARASFYEASTAHWSALLRGAMALYGRRPREGSSVESIVELMTCMFDGCLLHLFVDPSLNDPDLSDEERGERLDDAIDRACHATFEIAWAYTEPGLLEDPRKPEVRGDNLDTFDRVLEAAASLYQKDEVSPTTGVVEPGDAAEAAGVPVEAASVLFPTAGDLADSVLRYLVAPAGLEIDFQSAAGSPSPLIKPALWRLHKAAITHPGVILAAKNHPPTHPLLTEPFCDELIKTAAEALRTPNFSCSDPDETAAVLVGLALGGEPGWTALEAILRQIAPKSA